MKTQSEIKNNLEHFINNPMLDPFNYNKEMLIKFLNVNTLKIIYKEVDDKWKPIKLNEKVIINYLIVLLGQAYNIILMHKVVSIIRIMDNIKIILWILEDTDSIKFFDREMIGYRAHGLSIIQHLISKYKVHTYNV